jgi:hypothetical protein
VVFRLGAGRRRLGWTTTWLPAGLLLLFFPSGKPGLVFGLLALEARFRPGFDFRFGFRHRLEPIFPALNFFR